MRGYEKRFSRSAGLCSTCNSSSTCWHRTRRGFDAQHCELFDNAGEATGPVAIRGDEIMTTKGRSGEPQPQEVRTLKGLCLNCEIRETCMLPRPVEGVWHCEEYQ